MKPATLWLASTVALAAVAATVIAVSVASFDPAASALRQAVVPGPLSPGHAYLADRCASCHEPTVGVTVANCTTCHASDEAVLGRQPTAFHASIEECATCHVEHQGISLRAVMDHVELARIGAQTLASASLGGEADSATTLRSLETWLEIDGPDAFDAPSAREALDCAGCHSSEDPHLERFGGDCAQCHTLESWSVPGYRHPSPTSTDCVQCHRPPPSHGMGHFAMVSQEIANRPDAEVSRCFECHLTTSWNDIAGVGLYDHH